jgi:hypothetical protein
MSEEGTTTAQAKPDTLVDILQDFLLAHDAEVRRIWPNDPGNTARAQLVARLRALVNPS